MAKLAIVTGAGTGIGLAISHRLADLSFHVAAVGRRENKLQEMKAAYKGKGTIDIHPGDVGDRLGISQLISAIQEKHGPVDLLVNNAGVNAKLRSMAELSADEWDRQVRINLTGSYNTIAAVLPGMRGRGGLIINVSSIAGVRPSRLSGAAYAASKAGVNALSSVLTQEESRNGIRCTAICPGEVDTPILEERPEPVTAERRAKILQPEDIAAAVAFVVSLPPRAHVPSLVIEPTAMPWAG